MPPDVGMTGGGKLDAYLQGVAARIGRPTEVRSGFLAGSTEGDGTSTPEVAASNEWGVPSKGQPPRPFFRQMIAKHKGEWGAQLGKLLKANDYDAARCLGLMGEVIDGELRQSIIDLTSPKLMPVTVARKGFDKPLFETGGMLRRVAPEGIES